MIKLFETQLENTAIDNAIFIALNAYGLRYKNKTIAKIVGSARHTP
jgi:hypothetical protein